MSFPKIVILGGILLFGTIATMSYFNKEKKDVEKIEEVVIEKIEQVPTIEVKQETIVKKEELPFVDRIDQLFALDSSKLPIVETITFTDRVPWLIGRTAWIADYASFYSTSRHFIARSLNKKPDYFTQKVSVGNKFNVLKKDMNIEFHLLIDISRLKMWFSYVDMDKNEKVLLKTYDVALGKKDSTRESNCLTPLGKYKLGSRVAIYKPGIKGYFQDQKVEMITVFGTRWIPFGEEISGCTDDAEGLGIQGVPWVLDPDSNEYIEQKNVIGTYVSGGCIRVAQQDIEELFSIVITRPTTVELVSDYFQQELPQNEIVSE